MASPIAEHVRKPAPTSKMAKVVATLNDGQMQTLLDGCGLGGPDAEVFPAEAVARWLTNDVDHGEGKVSGEMVRTWVADRRD